MRQVVKKMRSLDLFDEKISLAINCEVVYVGNR